jgi:hypothetical protein
MVSPQVARRLIRSPILSWALIWLGVRLLVTQWMGVATLSIFGGVILILEEIQHAIGSAVMIFKLLPAPYLLNIKAVMCTQRHAVLQKCIKIT